MATKKASSKKSAKKGAAKKGGAKKAAAPLAASALIPHFQCLRRCFARYEACIRAAKTAAERRKCLTDLLACIRVCRISD